MNNNQNNNINDNVYDNQASTLEFIYSLFPDLDESVVKSILQKYHRNVEEAIDELLNKSEYSDDGVISVDESESEGGHGPDNVVMDDKWNDLRAKVENLKELFPNFSDGELESILQNNQLDTNRAANAMYENNKSSCLIERPPPPPSKAYHTKLLMEQFPTISEKSIENAIKLSGNDLNNAANYLLDGNGNVNASKSPRSGKVEPVCNKSCLEAGFPCLMHASTLTMKNITPNKMDKSPEKALKYIPPLTSLQSSSKNVYADGPRYLFSPKAIERHMMQQPSELNDKKKTLSVDFLSGGTVADSNLKSADYYNAKAKEYKEKRVEKIMMAVEMYSRGGLTGKSAAFVYAEDRKYLDRRKYNSERHLYMELEGRARFQENNSRLQNQYCIDLHGLSRKQALLYVSEGLAKWFVKCDNIPTLKKPNFTIITGRGAHSGNQGPKLFPSVKAYLKKKGWKFEVQDTNGAFIVSYGAG